MNKRITTIAMALCLLFNVAKAQISITSSTSYTQDFNSLPTVGTLNTNPSPAGWYRYDKPGSTAGDTVRVTSGTTTSGGFYSVGTGTNTDRAFGLLLSSSTKPLYLGAKFVNNTGSTIVSVAISYRCEQWRRGNTNAGKADTLLVEYINSTDSVQNGVWTNVPQLMGNSVVTTSTAGALDGNANVTTKTFTITGLNVPNGQTFWLRFNDYDISGSEDMLSVDDFSATFSTGSLPACVAPTASATSLVFTPSSSSISGSFTNSASADGYLVVYSTSATLGQTPVNGTTYSAGAAFGSGKVVQSAGSNTFNQTGLTPSTPYYFFVFAFNSACTGGITYRTTSLDGNASTTAIVIADCSQPSGVSNTSIIKLDSTATSISIKWTNPSNADSVMVIAGPLATIGFVTVRDSVFYPVSSTIPGSGATVYYRGKDSSLVINGLVSGTVYKILISPFNNKNCSNGPNYAALASITIKTAGAAVTCSAPDTILGVTVGAITGTTVSGTFGIPSTGADGYIVIYRKSSFLAAPSDSITYTLGQVITKVSGPFTDSSTIGFIGTNGANNAFTITGLSPLTKYYFAVIPYKTCSYGPNYNVKIGGSSTTNSNRGIATTTAATGVKNKNTEAEFNIYPNPTNTGSLFVKFKNNLKEEALMEIIDLLGQQLVSQKIVTGSELQTIDVSNYAKGTYILNIVYKGENNVSSFIVQ